MIQTYNEVRDSLFWILYAQSLARCETTLKILLEAGSDNGILCTTMVAIIGNEDVSDLRLTHA